MPKEEGFIFSQKKQNVAQKVKSATEMRGNPSPIQIRVQHIKFINQETTVERLSLKTRCVFKSKTFPLGFARETKMIVT